jgi:hypothetical protein
MLPQRSVEFLVQQDTFLPKGRLILYASIHADSAVDEATMAHDLATVSIGEEGQTAARNPAGLFRDHFVRGSTN